MRDLVQKLPSVSPQHDHGTSDDTIAAVLATLNEVIKKHPEFSDRKEGLKAKPVLKAVTTINNSLDNAQDASEAEFRMFLRDFSVRREIAAREGTLVHFDAEFYKLFEFLIRI